MIAATGLGKLRLNSHYSAYFNTDDPLLTEHNAVGKTFSRRDSIFIIIQSSAGNLLEPEHYLAIEDLTWALGELPGATSALSISELGISGEVLTGDGAVIPTLEQLQEHERAIGLLLSDDARLTGIRVDFELPGDSMAVLETLASVRDTVSGHIEGLPLSAHYSGSLTLNEAYINVVRHDLLSIVPLLLLAMVLVLGVLLGSVAAVITVLPVGIAAVVAAFGLAGLMGAELAAINAFVPIIILSISLAGCVHMALSFNHYRNQGLAAPDAALASVRFNRLPMALANATTALGFLGLSFSPAPPVRLVGFVVAAGVILSFVLCMTLLPVLQAWLDPRRTTGRADWFKIDWISRVVTERRALVRTVFLLPVIPAAWLVSGNVISDNVLEYFPESHPFHADTKLVEEHFSGISELLYAVETGQPNALFEVATIDRLESFAGWLRSQPEVIRVTSITDMHQIKEARAEGRLDERLANYKELAANNEVTHPLLVRELSSDFSAAVLGVYLQRLDSGRLVEFDRRIDDWLSRNLADDSVRRAGPSLMFAYLGENNIRSMLYALSAALLVAAIVLGLVLRSVRIALVGLVCNLLPVLLAYSVWALVNGRISLGAAVVMGMILGIVLDDSIYMLSTYRRAQTDKDARPVNTALLRVGPALIVTTITLMAGLSLGLLSDFGPIWSMSALSVSIIGLALLTDIFLLPSLLPLAGLRQDPELTHA